MKNMGFAVLLLFGGCWVKNDASGALSQPCKGLTLAGLSLEYEVSLMDTTLASGKYLDFSLREDSTIMIAWGNHEIGHIDAIESEKYPGWGPHFLKWEFENHLALRHSCGTSCWSLTLLPIHESDTVISLQEDLAVDTNRGYIFGNRCLNEDSVDFCLFNINTRKHQAINLPGLEWTGDIMTVLDTCGFVKEGLFVRWTCHENDFGLRDTIIKL